MNQDENPQFSTSSERPRSSRFPRTPLLPTQSPKYWVKEKDRYLRQLLIQDIQDQTQRELVVYFTFNGMIEFPDADDLSEILNGCSTKEIDLLIQTPGGVIDACEKLISVLKQRVGSYRVLIPGWAKSAGTIIALASTEIVMGSDSELGPIDPQFSGIPAEYLKDDEAQPYHVRQIAESAINRTRKLAAQILNEGMMQGRHQTHIEELVNQLSSTQSYLSHGAVINAQEVEHFGLNVTYLQPENDLWRRLRLLYSMYQYDCAQNGYGKVFEGVSYSIARAMPENS